VKIVDLCNDDKYIISRSKDNTLKIWELDSGVEIKTFKENIYIKDITIS
jgi:hypothetical protein